MAIRPFRKQDRAAVLGLLDEARAIDSPNHRLHVAEEGGGVVGVALWRQPDSGDEAFLGAVVVSQPNRWDLLYGLVAAAVRDALDRGVRTGSLTLSDERLLAKIQRDFPFQPTPSAWEPNTGRPVEWEIRADLADALQALERVI